MSTMTRKHWTAEELNRLPEFWRYEIDEGEFVIMSPAGKRHSRLTMRIARILGTPQDRPEQLRRRQGHRGTGRSPEPVLARVPPPPHGHGLAGSHLDRAAENPGRSIGGRPHATGARRK